MWITSYAHEVNEDSCHEELAVCEARECQDMSSDKSMTLLWRNVVIELKNAIINGELSELLSSDEEDEIAKNSSIPMKGNTNENRQG